MIVKHVETPVRGRYLLEPGPADWLLVGFHGYGETADAHLQELLRIPGIDRWTVIAVQALHPFYTRSRDVVASWMTRLDREFAIEDNVGYVRRVLDEVSTPRHLVFAGFSQGAAMAFRAAAYRPAASGLIVHGGDVPPDVRENDSVHLPPTLFGRGAEDEAFTEEQFNNDLSYLRTRARVVSYVHSGGHEWTDEFRAAAGEFLTTIRNAANAD